MKVFVITACVTVTIACGGLALGGTVVVDPDAFPVGTVLNHAFPGVTLTALGDPGVLTNSDVLVMASPLASTGTRVFGDNEPGNMDSWGNGSYDFLRVDFSAGAVTVSLDFITNDSGGDNNAVLRAFNVAGNQVAVDGPYFVPPPAGTYRTLTVSAPYIAWVQAEWDKITKTENGMLDHLTYTPVSVNHPPVCNANGPYTAQCGGAVTTIPLDGTGSSDPDPGDTLSYLWTTNCPGGSFDAPASATPTLSVDTSLGCSVSCTVTLKVTDSHGASATCSSTVSINDTTAPVISCPADVTVECDRPTDPGATGAASATDNCDPSPVVSFSDNVAPGVCGQASVITRTWTATDVCANSSSCTQVITIKDTTAPVITCPADQVSSADAECEGTVPDLCALASIADNCDQAPVCAQVPMSGTVIPLGQTDVALVATDACGNSSGCTIKVTVQDTTPPTVVVGEMVQIWPPNHGYRIFNLSDCVAEAVDNCGGTLDVDAAGMILSIYSDEPEDAQGNGDGKTLQDIVILGASAFKVRAEREGRGNGRVYGVAFEVTDLAGNKTQGTCYLGVPHDQSGSPAIDDGAPAGYTVAPR